MDALIAKFDPANAPDEVVVGFLHQRSKGALVGGSKTNKTWSLIDLGISVATRSPWWGLETTQGKVLYINFELDDFHFTNRVILVRNAKGVSKLNGNFDYFGFRGKARDWTKLMSQLEQKLKGGGYTLVIIDPLYKGLGNRSENDAGDMTDLHNEIEGLAVASGAAVVYGHHFAKGAQGKKNVEDRGSGSGVFARDPDSILTITRLSEVDGYVVETVLRNFKQLPSFGLRWDWPLMVPDDSMDISRIHEPGKAQTCSKEDILDALRAQGELHHEEWYAAVSESIRPGTISMSTFKRRVVELKACGDVVQVPGTKRTDPWKAA